MKAHDHDTTITEKKASSRGISERGLMLLVALLLGAFLFLMLYYYHAAKTGTLAPTPTPPPPTVTPILDADGKPALIHAWFPALQGESFFALGPDGETLLVDAGFSEDADALLAFLKTRQVTTLDAVFLSLAEEKYIGAMAAIVEAFPIKTFYLTPETAADTRSKSLLDLLEKMEVPTQQVHASFVSTVDWAENAELRILSPHDVSYDTAADTSLMLRLAYGSSEILLAGSAGALAERMAVKALPNELLHADVLKLANQGSAGSTSERFLGAVKPDLAIVCGSSRDELPAKSVVDRLAQQNTQLLSTAQLGTIEIVLDGVAAKVVE